MSQRRIRCRALVVLAESEVPKAMAEEKFRALAEAYEAIKAERGWS